MRRKTRFETLESRQLLAADITFNSGLGRVLVEGTDGVDQVVVETQNNQLVVLADFDGQLQSASFDLDKVTSILFRGRDGNDRFENLSAIPSVAYGNSGDDELLGGSGSDRFHGGPGNDLLDGRGGEDDLHGDYGDDTLLGGDGNDKLYGWYGDDTLEGGSGDDYVSGYEGNDTLSGGAGDDDLHGHLGNDLIRGDEGNDRLYGFRGNDDLDGGDGDDYLSGWVGNDLLKGGDGNDTLRGHAGNDKLYGGNGDDYADGGSGHDRIFGDAGDYDRLFGGSGHDQLYDLDGVLGMHGGTGNDILDLAFREGWRKSGAKRFDGKLSGGDGDDHVSIHFAESDFFINVTGDDRANPASPTEGNHDKLKLTGAAINPGSVIIKFEHIDESFDKGNGKK